MHIPQSRERVFVAGRIGVFLVVWIDHERKQVDLIPLRAATSVEQSVPFSKLESYREDVHSNQRSFGFCPFLIAWVVRRKSSIIRDSALFQYPARVRRELAAIQFTGYRISVWPL